MAAAKFDIVLEEHSDFVQAFVYKDKDKNIVDVTAYGARIVMSKNHSEPPFYDADNISGAVEVGTTDGLFIIRVPFEVFSNKNIVVGSWQFYIYPTSGSFADRPRRLVEGSFTYSPSLIHNV